MIIYFFNELCIYILVKAMLGDLSLSKNCTYKNCPHNNGHLLARDCSVKINIDDDKWLFHYFLYDTHYRNLSRSKFDAHC